MRAWLVVFVLLTSWSAHAFGSFVARMPSGSFANCQTCHVRTTGGEGWNLFGQAILIAGGANPSANPTNQNAGYNHASPTWTAALCHADSDGDGQSNGAELGDPNCVWSLGQTPARTVFLARPGDATSTSRTPTATDDDDHDDLRIDRELTLGTDPNVADTDGDGLSDGQEDQNHNGVRDGSESNALVADTDGDGFSDGFEITTSHTSPVLADTDGDGIGDFDEDTNHNGIVDVGETDPKLADTDGDGLSDSLELTLGTNPLVADSDGDGLSDGQEDANHNGIVDATETDPNNADSDGGGLNDGDERAAHKNPLDAADDLLVIIVGEGEGEGEGEGDVGEGEGEGEVVVGEGEGEGEGEVIAGEGEGEPTPQPTPPKTGCSASGDGATLAALLGVLAWRRRSRAA
jgi:hypothetical protein